MGWTNIDDFWQQPQTQQPDLLAVVIRCDFCKERKELRYFAETADSENYFSICQDCKELFEQEDLRLKQEKIAESLELNHRHGE